jgi:3D (Asp-Asp-Asp) domain-containing protein
VLFEASLSRAAAESHPGGSPGAADSTRPAAAEGDHFTGGAARLPEAASPPNPGLGRRNRSLVAELTAYSASEAEGTAWGITYTGTHARPGTVAVDPTYIPLGSRLHIAGLPGVYLAEDTGGGIRGAHVDIFMRSREALAFGRRSGVLVELLD